MARGGECSFADLFFGDEETGALRLSAVLRAIGQKRLKTLVYEGRDVDDEGGANVGIETRIEDLVGAMRRVGFALRDDLGEAADEAGFVA